MFHYCCCSTCKSNVFPLAAAIGPLGVLLPSERERLAGRTVPCCSKDADIPTSWTFASTPLKFNVVPWKRNNPIRKALFQPSFFRGYVNFRGSKPLLCLFVLKNFSDNPLPHLKNDYWWHSSWAVLVQRWNSRLKFDIYINTFNLFVKLGYPFVKFQECKPPHYYHRFTWQLASTTSPWPWDGKAVKMYQTGNLGRFFFFRVMRTF